MALAAATPMTSTGVERSMSEPSPSWPYWLLPQHRTPPLCRSAQVWLPAATATAVAQQPFGHALKPVGQPPSGVGGAGASPGPESAPTIGASPPPSAVGTPPSDV